MKNIILLNMKKRLLRMNGVLSIALATLCFAAPVRADLTKNEMRLISVKNGAELLIQKGSGGEMTPGWLTLGCDHRTHPDCRWLSLIGVNLIVDWTALVAEARRSPDAANAHRQALDNRGQSWTVTLTKPRDGKPTDDPGSFVWSFDSGFAGYKAVFGPSSGASQDNLYSDMPSAYLPQSGRVYTGSELKGGVEIVAKDAWNLEMEKLRPSLYERAADLAKTLAGY